MRMIRMDVSDPDRARLIKGFQVRGVVPLQRMTLRMLKERVQAGEGQAGARVRFNLLQQNLRGHQSYKVSDDQIGLVLNGVI